MKRFVFALLVLASAAQAQDVINYAPPTAIVRSMPAPAPAAGVSNATPAPSAMPHFPISPTIADLRVGITAEQCRLILGNPQEVNGRQWVYARGYIYVEDGVVVAMQNKAGAVFAADWK